MFTSPAYKT